MFYQYKIALNPTNMLFFEYRFPVKFLFSSNYYDNQSFQIVEGILFSMKQSMIMNYLNCKVLNP